MDHSDAIKIGLKSGHTHTEIARKVYLGYPTSAFIGNEELEYLIINKISKYFQIPYSNVQVVGSAKLGFSCHKENKFNPATSDLDIAIINKDLFFKYIEIVYEKTNGYGDQSGFPKNEFGVSRYGEYIKYIARGIFRPDLMPSCMKKAEWRTFFTQLSAQHSSYFKSINCGIYSTEFFFESKQKNNISEYKSRSGL